jgi:hypothetical protein
MSFTNNWLISVPTDAQIANTYGEVMRNARVDIQERLGGFGAGTLAARPTPDTAFGADFTGVKYYATDTSQMFRWDGAAWDEVFGFGYAGSILRDNHSPVNETITILTVPVGKSGIYEAVFDGFVQTGPVTWNGSITWNNGFVTSSRIVAGNPGPGQFFLAAAGFEANPSLLPAVGQASVAPYRIDSFYAAAGTDIDLVVTGAAGAGTMKFFIGVRFLG